MPIYEFYCEKCHALFNFFSARIDTETLPPCPREQDHELQRRPARFAMITSSEEVEGSPEDDLLSGLDENRLEAAMAAMEGDMSTLGDEEDPRAMAGLFRRFGELAGLEMGSRMEEVLQRLESGEDPDALDEELGDDFGDPEGMEDWIRLRSAAKKVRDRKPILDDELYFM